MENYTTDKKFKALVVEEIKGTFVRSIKEKTLKELPQGDLLVRVHYSSLNYKDALSASGNKGVTKSYPHTPGIDAAGVVEWSASSDFHPGDEVIVTGFDLGMNTDGGYGQYIRVPATWAVKLPQGLSRKESMILGTAGFTAAIMVKKLTDSVAPSDGEVVVTGATGGVGVISVALLSALGYSVVAVSGKMDEIGFLKQLGACRVVSRNEIMRDEPRPLLSATYAGAVDTVGGVMLENILKVIQPYGVVTCCGNVASPKLNTTVFPFILRGVSLLGVSAQNTPMPLRKLVWQKLAAEWKPASLLDVYTEIHLDELSVFIDKILAGKIKGRTLVNML